MDIPLKVKNNNEINAQKKNQIWNIPHGQP